MASGSLWRLIRPLSEGATAPWLRLHYNLLYELFFAAGDTAAVARIAVAKAYQTFRGELVALGVRGDGYWNILAYEGHGTLVPPPRVPLQQDPNGPTYHDGQVLDVPDLVAFAQRFPAMTPLVESGVRAMAVASFGSRVHEAGYLAFFSSTPQHYSDDEYVLMSLYALTIGIGLDRFEGAQR